MASPWFRVWSDMVNDPKWRTIARISKQSIGDVIATYVHMMTLASNATERGRTEGWCDEDIATALDIETEQITAIRDAMQGRVLDGDVLSGWEKRQPTREDGSAERSKAFRERKRLEKEEIRPQPTATDHNQPLEEIREEKRREELKSKAESAIAKRLPADWIPEKAEIIFLDTERPDLSLDDTVARFRDYWVAQPGAKGRKVDWPATWRNWVRNENRAAARTPQARPDKFNPTAYVNRNRKSP